MEQVYPSIPALVEPRLGYSVKELGAEFISKAAEEHHGPANFGVVLGRVSG